MKAFGTAATVAGALAAFSTAGVAHAAYTVTYTQGGGNVTAVGSGTLDTTGLSRDTDYDSYGPIAPFTEPAQTTLIVGSQGFQGYDVDFNLQAGPFGSGSLVNGSGTGGGVYLNDDGNQGYGVIGVPINYASGSEINNGAVYTGETFAKMGLNVGDYVFTYGSGANADTFNVDVSAIPTVLPPGPVSAAPEPSVWALMMVGVAGLGLALRRAKADGHRRLRAIVA